MGMSVGLRVREVSERWGVALALHAVVCAEGSPCVGPGWSSPGMRPLPVGHPVATLVPWREDGLVDAFARLVPTGLADEHLGFIEHEGAAVGVLVVRVRPGATPAYLDAIRAVVGVTFGEVLGTPVAEAASFHLLFDPTGHLCAVSTEAPLHALDPSHREALAAAVRAVGRDGGSTIVAGFRVELRPLVGEDGPRVLANLVPVTAARVPALARLSPTQATIARYAGSGATVPEIARTLDRSAETIRTHLREVYRRLGVTSRVELAWLARELDAWAA
jgi:DNA-binding CsgD family transcriptional regulator